MLNITNSVKDYEHDIFEIEEQIAWHGWKSVQKGKLKRALHDLAWQLNKDNEERVLCDKTVRDFRELFQNTPFLEDAMNYCRIKIRGNDNYNPLAGCYYQKLRLSIDENIKKLPSINKKIEQLEKEQNFKNSIWGYILWSFKKAWS